MTYVTDQNSAELRAHMRRLQKMAGWHNPLDDRLFAEILALDEEIKALRAASQPTAGQEEREADIGPVDWRAVLSNVLEYCAEQNPNQGYDEECDDPRITSAMALLRLVPPAPAGDEGGA